MTFTLPNIVVVDNDQQELDTIKNAFFEGGIPCLPIKYENDDPKNLSGIDHASINDGLNPRILVLDLNLTELQGATPPNLVGPLAEVIKKLPVIGPYLLCIWSKHAGLVEDVVTILQQRYAEHLTMPLQYSVISKDEFKTDPAGLRKKIEGLISESPLFDSLLTWESRISSAARETINSLFELAEQTKQDDSIDGCAIQFKKILSKIGNEALGLKHAAETSALALDVGLEPVIQDQLSEMLGDDLDGKWQQALPEIGSHIDLDDSVKASLNSFFHIEEVKADFSQKHRGVFIELDKDYINNNEQKFNARIGKPLKTLVHDEFIATDVGDKPSRQKVRDSLILGFLEISAACDHAQRKITLPRYILGVLIPHEYSEYTHFPRNGGERSEVKHDGIYRFPLINFRDKSYIAKFSFKYQFGAQPGDNKWFHEPLFRVREQILSEITFKNTQYQSRPGIMSFR